MWHMFRRTIFLWVSLCLYGACPTWVLAGAWTQERGHFYAKLTGSLYQAEEYFDDTGNQVVLGDNEDVFEDLSAYFYLEYGLLDRLTMVMSLPAKQLTAKNRFLSRVTKGIGDVNVGIKYLLKSGPAVLSLMGGAKIPPGYHEEYQPPLGAGQIDIEMRFLVGRSFYPIPAYVNGEGALRIRTEEFANEVAYLFEFGYTFAGRVLLKGMVTGVKSLASEEDRRTYDVLGIVDQGFLKLGPDIIFRISDRLEFDFLYERTVSGRNTGAGSSYGVGLAYKY